MKDKEARQATLANKMAIEHFFETEREFIDKIAELEARVSYHKGELMAIRALLDSLVKDAYEASENTRENILITLGALAKTNLVMLEEAEKDQSGLKSTFLAGSQSVLSSVNQMLKE